MITTVDSSVTISFEFSLEELDRIYGCLNSADVQLLKRIDLAKDANIPDDVKYYTSCEDLVSDFIENFNPARYFNLKRND